MPGAISEGCHSSLESEIWMKGKLASTLAAQAGRKPKLFFAAAWRINGVLRELKGSGNVGTDYCRSMFAASAA